MEARARTAEADVSALTAEVARLKLALVRVPQGDFVCSLYETQVAWESACARVVL